MNCLLTKLYKTRLDRLVNSYYELQQTIKEIEAKQYAASVQYDQARSPSKEATSRIEKMVALKNQLIEKVINIEDEYIQVNNELADFIKMLPEPNEQKVLCYYFYKVPTFEKVLKTMKIGRGEYFVILSEALQKLEVILATKVG